MNNVVHSTAEDFAMQTQQEDRIVLPYHGPLSGYLRDCAEEAVRLSCDGCRVPVLDAAVRMRFGIQRMQIHVTACMWVHTKRGDHIYTTVGVRMDDRDLGSILDRFFSAGAVGLAPDFRAYFYQVYQIWRGRTA